MQQIIQQLESLIIEYRPQIEYISHDEFMIRPSPEKWSKKEVLGHLVDSALSNSRRFVVGQYEENPAIGYQQGAWVKIADYQNYPINNLINLWALLNLHIVIILKNIPPGKEERKCLTDELHSIK